MQRPITATQCLSYKDAYAALPGVRKNLKYRGLTQDPFPMCAIVQKWGGGWAVFVGFQNSVDLSAVPEEFQERLTSEFSALTHSM
ncbi:hypothetical protein [Streptomyces mirabilis]|uniref:hypothetical protein n=1 Tax=Streptomyces mirabilis TaxID=68239 RepID=UPI00368D94E0